jgi:hypothetical protein
MKVWRVHRCTAGVKLTLGVSRENGPVQICHFAFGHHPYSSIEPRSSSFAEIHVQHELRLQ